MDYTLDDERKEIVLTGAEQNRELALALAQRARREILIASYDLDHRLYSNQEFVDALSAFVRAHRYAHVHILVWRHEPAVKQGHRLIELAQRLGSRIKIHEPDPVHGELIESYMVVDGIAYFRRPLADRFEGIASLHAPIVARDLREQFLAMWERSSPSSEFRRLGI
ncbi:MAG: hypothetical protein OQL08_11135 [Gammaproteobacteria bacterium]|nr:hypothetical protein [Gammaproteobacteria bacterium]